MRHPRYSRDGRHVYFDVAEKNFLLRAGDPERRSDFSVIVNLGSELGERLGSSRGDAR